MRGCRTVVERMLHLTRRLPVRQADLRVGRYILPAIILALLVTTGVAAALAQTRSAARGFVWTVERDGRTSWLVGSLHVLTQDSYPLPGAMDKAFEQARTLMEETDVNELSSPEMVGIVATKGLFTNGQTLDSVLSRESYAQLA